MAKCESARVDKPVYVMELQARMIWVINTIIWLTLHGGKTDRLLLVFKDLTTESWYRER